METSTIKAKEISVQADSDPLSILKNENSKARYTKTKATSELMYHQRHTLANFF